MEEAFELEMLEGFRGTGSEVSPWRQGLRQCGRQEPQKQKRGATEGFGSGCVNLQIAWLQE